MFWTILFGNPYSYYNQRFFSLIFSSLLRICVRAKTPKTYVLVSLNWRLCKHKLTWAFIAFSKYGLQKKESNSFKIILLITTYIILLWFSTVNSENVCSFVASVLWWHVPLYFLIFILSKNTTHTNR